MGARTAKDANTQKTELAQLRAAVAELQTAVNNLRTDFRAHDHGGTYGATTVRLGASAGTFSGQAELSAAAVNPIPATLMDDEATH